MRKAKIYKPSKTAMQSGRRNTLNWLLEYEVSKTGVNPLTGWETSKDTLSEVKLYFPDKKSAIRYANKNNIDYFVIEPKKRKIIIKPYTNNFLKD